jgi:hypothetical protein
MGDGESCGMGEVASEEAKTGGATLTSWSRSGQAKNIPFTLDGVSADSIEISGQTIKGPRKISRPDFDFVADRCGAYLNGQLRRDELSRSQNTTHILTILHWLDSN